MTMPSTCGSSLLRRAFDAVARRPDQAVQHGGRPRADHRAARTAAIRYARSAIDARTYRGAGDDRLTLSPGRPSRRIGETCLGVCGSDLTLKARVDPAPFADQLPRTPAAERRAKLRVPRHNANDRCRSGTAGQRGTGRQERLVRDRNAAATASLAPSGPPPWPRRFLLTSVMASAAPRQPLW